MRLVKKHNIDLLGLQETHLHDQGVLDAQTWWLRKNGFAANFNRQLDQSDKGSSGLVWRESKWEHVSSVAMGQRFLISHMRAKAGGDLRVLTGHFSCDPSQRRQQWERLESKLQAMPPLPMVVLADHNSIMVPGVDSGQRNIDSGVSKESGRISPRCLGVAGCVCAFTWGTARGCAGVH